VGQAIGVEFSNPFHISRKRTVGAGGQALFEEMQRDVKKYKAISWDLRAVAGLGESASAQCNDVWLAGRLLNYFDEYAVFVFAEYGFAVLLKKCADSLSGAEFDLVIKIAEGKSELVGGELSEGGFATTHESGEEEGLDVCGHDGF
jgi:hypothetical protein